MNKNTIDSIKKWLKEPEYEFESEKYSAHKSILFYRFIHKKAFARIVNDELYFHINDDNRKAMFKTLKIAKDVFQNNIYFIRYLFYEKESHSYETIRYDDLESMIYHYSKKEFFYEFKKIGFDFKRAISNYIDKFKVGEIFDEVYDNEVYDDPKNDGRSPKILGKEYFDNNHPFNYDLKFKVEDETIRSELYNINRKLKIGSILDYLEDNSE